MSITLNTPNEPRREHQRRASHRDRVLDALREAGETGVLNTHLMSPEIGGSRAGGRVQELRDAGYVITCSHVEGGLYRYTLHAGSRPRPGEPGFLASLVPVASIQRHVMPVREDETPRDGCLF